VRRRGECIGGAVPDIAPAVAVEIHRMGVVGGWDELGLPHGASPGAAHAGGADIAALDDFQRREQLALGEGGAAALMGQGGQ